MNKYAVLIGNSQFPDESDKSKLPDLACPLFDVDGLEKVLASERGEFEVLSLKNQPSYQILRELQRKVRQADSEDLLLLYYSGHGKPNKSGLLHLTTLDTVIAELEASAIPINRVYDILGTGRLKKIVILLDCCYSGAAGQGFKGAVDDQLQQLNNARGTYLVTASTELQVAHENAEEGLSLFTKHLIAGLETGEADKDGDGWVSMNELYDYVQGKVVAENPAQHPTEHVKDRRGMNLPIAKSGKSLETEKQLKFFYYISRQKIEMLSIQLKTFLPIHDTYSLICNTNNVIKFLKNNGKITKLTTNINTSKYIEDCSLWNSGLYSFLATGEQITTYLSWKMLDSTLILLVGSPNNILGNKVVNDGIRVPGSSGALLDVLEFINQIKTDEPRAVSANELPFYGTYQGVNTKKLSENVVELSKDSIERTTEIHREMKIYSFPDVAEFCLNYLNDLPITKIDTIFKIYSTFKDSNRIVYIGSPLYIAID